MPGATSVERAVRVVAGSVVVGVLAVVAVAMFIAYKTRAAR